MKTHRRFAFVLAATLLILAPSALLAAGGLDQTIDIDLKDAPVADTLSSFGKILQARSVDLDPAITGVVTVHLTSVPAKDAMDAVCKGVGCSWTFENGKLRFESTRPPLARADARLDQPIDLKLEGADLGMVLRTFGQLSGLDVDVAEGITGKVTISLEDVPARKALDALCETYHCHWEVAVLAAGPKLLFTPAQ